GEAIATRYDPNADMYHVATTSGAVFKFTRVVIEKARARESEHPPLFGFDGQELPLGEGERARQEQAKAMMKAAKDAQNFKGPSIQQMVEELSKQYEEYAKKGDEQREKYHGSDECNGLKAEAQPKTLEEAWEMAEARLCE